MIEYFTLCEEVDSSAISTITYDDVTKRLWVEFHSGNLAGYADVSRSVVNEFMRAPSVGRFYSQWIRGQYTGLDSYDLDFHRRDAKDYMKLTAVTPADIGLANVRSSTEETAKSLKTYLVTVEVQATSLATAASLFDEDAVRLVEEV